MAIGIAPAYLILRSLGAGREAWLKIATFSTLQVVGRSLGLAAAVVIAALLISLPLAFLTERSDLPGRRIWTVLAILPMVIPSYIAAYLFASALGPRGLLAQWLESMIGLESLPSIYGFPGAFLVLSLSTYPYLYLPIRAALKRIDPAMEAASRSLGHSPWQTMRRITLPLLMPAISAGSLLVALYVLRDFGAVALMRFNSLTRVIYIRYGSFDREGASLLSLLLIGLALMIVMGESFTKRGQRARYHDAGAQAFGTPSRIALGVWRWPALIFCTALVSIALFMPAGMLLHWLWRGLAGGAYSHDLWLPLWGSISSSLLAAVFTVLAALPIALLLRDEARANGKLGRSLSTLSWTGHALPGIVIALAMVFVGTRLLRPLYQSMSLLLLSYIVLFIPLALAVVRHSLSQIHPSLEEAAHTMGYGPIRSFKSVTLPQIKAGLGAGAGLVFLSAMKELPATLILSPFGHRSLATSVWSALSEAFFAEAALPALLIILLSSGPMAIWIMREER